MNLKQAKELVRSRLSDKRYEHTINVKKMAVKLAKHYGADEEQAALAALLHDAAKEISKDEMRAIMQADTPDTTQAGQVAGEVFELREKLRAKAQEAGLPFPMMGMGMGMGMGPGCGFGDGDNDGWGRGDGMGPHRFNRR